MGVLASATLATAAAQEPKPEDKPSETRPSPANALGPLVPLDVQVVVNRYQGDKRVSSLPYALAVNANDRSVSSIRMGARVPVVGTPVGSAPNAAVQVTYENVGTNIDCFARTMEDGRFQVNVTIEDSSVYQNVEGAIAPTAAGRPVMRQFRSANTMVLRDGQTRQFTVATDRVNGEVVRIEVMLRVVK
jgi:hypothetical protein